MNGFCESCGQLRPCGCGEFCPGCFGDVKMVTKDAALCQGDCKRHRLMFLRGTSKLRKIWLKLRYEPRDLLAFLKNEGFR